MTSNGPIANTFDFRQQGIRTIQWCRDGHNPPLMMADLCMTHLKATLIDELIEMGDCECYRCVDDTFVLVQTSSHIHNIPIIFNSFHSAIKFKYATKTSHSIPFLDLRVTLSPARQKFETIDCTKLTNTDLIIH
jgi:hypothetical protein